MSLNVISKIKQDSAIKARLVTFAITGTSSYTTGGDVFTPAMIGLSDFDFVGIEMQSGYSGTYDYTNKKIMFYGVKSATMALTEIDSGTDLSAITFNCVAIGR